MRLKTLELNFPYKRNDEFIRDKMEKGMTAMEANVKIIRLIGSGRQKDSYWQQDAWHQ